MSKVELISDAADYVGCVELLDHMGSDLDIVNAARVSFNKEARALQDKDVKLIKYLWENKHTSPFEHCVIKFRIEVPLFVAKQHMRHRTWSYNEVSRRYTSDDIKFYTPSLVREQAKSNRQVSTDSLIDPVIFSVAGEYSQDVMDTTASEGIKQLTDQAFSLYNKLLQSGVCREQARGVLPQNMLTKYIATANLLNVFKFLSLRNKPEAQYEMRLLASAVETLTSHLFPAAYSAYKRDDVVSEIAIAVSTPKKEEK